MALDQIIKKILNYRNKIASCDLTNLSLIEHCAKTGIPLILSTGMSYERNIIDKQILQKLMVEHAFLHCNSTYPSPSEDINLKYIKRLQNITQTIVGFSSHDGNSTIPIGDMPRSKIVEFHITRSIELDDHRASIETKDIKKLVQNSKLVHTALGESKPRILSRRTI